jgi:hypothetical protein
LESAGTTNISELNERLMCMNELEASLKRAGLNEMTLKGGSG